LLTDQIVKTFEEARNYYKNPSINQEEDPVNMEEMP